MSSKTNTTKTTNSSSRTYKVDANGVVRDRKITNKTTTTNAISKHSFNAANKIGKILPSARQFLAILLFLPLIVLAITVLFDIPNYTFFRTITVNGQELTRFDSFGYLKNLEGVANNFKTMLSNTFAPNTLPSIENFTDNINWTEWWKVLVNIQIIPINLLTGFVNTIFAIIQSIVLLFRLLFALIGIDLTGNNENIRNLISTLDSWGTYVRIPPIPYL